MGQKKDVTEWQKGAIAFGLSKGHSAREVAEFTELSRQSVLRIYKQWCSTQSTRTRRSNCGRKSLINEEARGRLIRLLAENRCQSRHELLQALNEGAARPVSERTLRRELQFLNQGPTLLTHHRKSSEEEAVTQNQETLSQLVTHHCKSSEEEAVTQNQETLSQLVTNNCESSKEVPSEENQEAKSTDEDLMEQIMQTWESTNPTD